MIGTTRKGKNTVNERARAGRAAREGTASAQEIGAIPAVANPERRGICSASFKFFCLTYFPQAFYLGFSKDHDELIERMEETANDGGLVAFALPRGSGKTTISIKLAEWVLLTGRRKFIALIGASEDKAGLLLTGIKTDFMHNEMLIADFPEVCYPLAKLEGEPRRASGQTVAGVRTCSIISAGKLVLPTIEGSKASGSIVAQAGITGAIRGMQHTTKEGRILRPDFVLIDDPQSNESAHSPSQTLQRLAVINGDILGLSGPGVKIAGFCPCTVICKDDLADRLFDPVQSPEWRGIRKRLVHEMPKNMELWEQYRALRDEDLRTGKGDKGEARQFYIDNREAMDEGAVVAWEERKSPSDVSALQAAMHLLFRDASSFWSEYQNAPLVADVQTKYLQASDILKQTNGHSRGVVPDGCTHITAAVDVQGTVLYWTVMAWEENMTGYVLDYGVFPAQRNRSLALSDCKHTLVDEFPGKGKLGAIHAGIKALAGGLIAKKFKVNDGSEMKVSLCLVDSGYETATVFDAIQQLNSANVLPWKGVACKATGKPISEWRKDRGARSGPGWLIPKAKGRALRLVIADAWEAKTRLIEGLATAIGDPGSVSVFNLPSGYKHDEYAAQLTANTPKEVSCGSRTVIEYRVRPGCDDHLGDTTSMCMVAASICGCRPIMRIESGGTIDTGIAPRDETPTLADNLGQVERKKIDMPSDWESNV